MGVHPWISPKKGHLISASLTNLHSLEFWPPIGKYGNCEGMWLPLFWWKIIQFCSKGNQFAGMLRNPQTVQREPVAILACAFIVGGIRFPVDIHPKSKFKVTNPAGLWPRYWAQILGHTLFSVHPFGQVNSLPGWVDWQKNRRTCFACQSRAKM